MATINPNIALSVKPLQLENPMNAMAMYSQIQGAQQSNELNRMKMDEYERARQEEEGVRNALARGDIKLDTPEGRAGLLQYGKTGLEYGKALTEQQKAVTDRQTAEAKLVADRTKQYRAALDFVNTPEQYLAWHEANHADPIVGPALAAAGVTAESSRANIMKQLSTPGGFEKLINQSKLGAEKFIERNTLTANEKAIDLRARENIDIARKRLEKDNAMLDPAENAAISKAILEGRLDPNRVNGRNAKILATTLMSNPNANILELGVSASGATAAERSLATQTAKMSTAANEANDMVAVVRDLSDKVDRTEFPSINAITNAVSKGTGGKEIVQLNASINALVNSYARAISPTGQPTVSDKNHAREVINSAYSTGQIGAILDVMQQEMAIARKSAGTASTELKQSRETARGRGTELQGQDKQALEWANKNPNDPRAAAIKQRLGL